MVALYALGVRHQGNQGPCGEREVGFHHHHCVRIPGGQRVEDCQCVACNRRESLDHQGRIAAAACRSWIVFDLIADSGPGGPCGVGRRRNCRGHRARAIIGGRSFVVVEDEVSEALIAAVIEDELRLAPWAPRLRRVRKVDAGGRIRAAPSVKGHQPEAQLLQVERRDVTDGGIGRVKVGDHRRGRRLILGPCGLTLNQSAEIASRTLTACVHSALELALGDHRKIHVAGPIVSETEHDDDRFRENRRRTSQESRGCFIHRQVNKMAAGEF